MRLESHIYVVVAISKDKLHFPNVLCKECFGSDLNLRKEIKCCLLVFSLVSQMINFLSPPLSCLLFEILAAIDLQLDAQHINATSNCKANAHKGGGNTNNNTTLPDKQRQARIICCPDCNDDDDEGKNQL